MDTWLWLATTAAPEAGFGVNFNPLETNLVNLSIALGILFYFGRPAVGRILTNRRSDIETALREAEARLQAAQADLAEQQKNLAQAQQEAEQIRQQAQRNANQLREEILAKAAADIELLRRNAAQDLSTTQERIVTQLRRQIAQMTLEHVEARLQAGIDPSVQQRLIDRSISRV